MSPAQLSAELEPPCSEPCMDRVVDCRDCQALEGVATLSSQLIPCAVVVDSRNLRGQAGKVFGWPRSASVDGVRRALELYGFDAIDIYFGVATRSSDGSKSAQITKSLETNREYRDRLQADGATVLEGYLAERQGKTEEKQVDVLCAVKVCELADRIATRLHPAKCIVVLSEDMDLMPAYDFAAERGVKAYAAAYDTIFQREDQRDWLILHEPSLIQAVAPVGRYIGSELRAKMAMIATSKAKPAAMRWTVHAPAGEGRFLMKGNLGAPAIWAPGSAKRVGEKADLYVTALAIHPEKGGRFPHFVLSDSPPTAQPLPDVRMATVQYWQNPTSVRVQFDDQTAASVRALPGTLLPGQQVAVLRRSAPGGQANYLIGPCDQAKTIPGWSANDRVARIEVGGRRTEAWLDGKVLATAERVLLHSGHLRHAEAGSVVIGFVSGSASWAGLPTVMPLTCCVSA